MLKSRSALCGAIGCALFSVAVTGCNFLGMPDDPAAICSNPQVLQDLVKPGHDPEFKRPELATAWAEATERIGANGLSNILLEKFDPQTKRAECSASVNLAGIPEDTARLLLASDFANNPAIQVGSLSGKLDIRVHYSVAPLANGSSALIGFDDPEGMAKLALDMAILLAGPLKKHDYPEPTDGGTEDTPTEPGSLLTTPLSTDEPTLYHSPTDGITESPTI
ncbi:hypothetical protein [Novosphingobium clariflavum]|uniref:Lipoprotein n=1 Tax=Novosphingobium clariflavum TaxID=2029884 RepID=A0ABV6S4L6_9SPHN|nr:hypothetical protein [Novosphingobium clariflavum]